MRYKWYLLFLFSGGLPGLAQEHPVSSALDSNAIKTLFFAGLRDKLNENYVKAAENFNKILTINPDNAAVYYEIAALNYRQNKLSEAETAIKKATALDTNNIWYWKLLAELYKRRGNMDDLVGVFNQMIRLSPETDSYYFDRSNAFLLAGKTNEALKGYDELEKKFGPSAELTQARQRISMEKNGSFSKKELEGLLSEESGDVKSLLYTSGVLIEKNQNDDALSLLKKAKLLEKDNYEVDLALADVYKALKKDPEAKMALKDAFNNPVMPVDQKVKIVMMLFTGVKNQQLISDASELASIVVKTHPNDPKVFALYGDILYQQGDLNTALEQFKSALKITDQLYVVWERVLNIQTSLGLYKEAITTGDEALSIYPNQAILYYYMALALLNDGQNSQALTNIRAALQLDAENPVYLECYGDILFLKGDSELAMVQWEKAKNGGNGSEKLIRKINEKKYIK